MKFSFKAAFLLVVCLGIAALLVFAFLPQPVIVEVSLVQRGAMSVSVDEDGKTRIKERYVVSSPLSGRLLRVKLDPGDKVVRGKTLVATIEPTDPALLDARTLAQARAKVSAAQAALKQASPQVERARVAMTFAESDHARLVKLVETDAVTQDELDDSELLFRTRSQEVRSAEFARDIARFELEMAKAALLRTSPDEDGKTNVTNFPIRSPINGRVLKVIQESATVVAAGSRLLELGDPRDLEVEVDVLSKDAVRINPGDGVRLEQWGGDEPLAGIVRLVEPQAFTKISALGVEEQRVNVVIDFLEPPEKRQSIGDGYRVEAKIITWHHDNVLQVPTNALFRNGDDWAVFVIRDGRAARQAVSIGHRSGFVAEVLEGLQPDDQVIMNPSDKVRGGVRVEASRTSP